MVAGWPRRTRGVLDCCRRSSISWKLQPLYACTVFCVESRHSPTCNSVRGEQAVTGMCATNQRFRSLWATCMTVTMTASGAQLLLLALCVYRGWGLQQSAPRVRLSFK
ncbi:hypothetical protein ILYODFUR_009684, partial [Ilyodon furcidens]